MTNRSTFLGKVIEIQEQQSFKVFDRSHTYTPLVIAITDEDFIPLDSLLYIQAWDHKQQRLDGVLTGDKVLVTVNICSERNKKDPKMFYHKVTLSNLEKLN